MRGRGVSRARFLRFINMVEPGFVAGLAQPLLASGMLLPLLATALFLGQQWGVQPGWPVTVAWVGFALSLAVALVLSLSDALPLTRVPWPSLLAAALGGLAVALGRLWGAAALVAVAAMLGAGVGLAAIPPPASASAAALPGLLTAGLFVGSLVWAVAAAVWVRWLRWGWALVGVRVLASWVAAASLIVLALSVSQGWV
jgi:hypothetical protein